MKINLPLSIYYRNKRRKRREAAKKFTEKNQQVKWKAVKIYSEKNAEVYRREVNGLDQANPEVHMASVSIYTKRNLKFNQDFVKKVPLIPCKKSYSWVLNIIRAIQITLMTNITLRLL